MKHILSFTTYLVEALSREEANRYHTAWEESGGEQRYVSWFGGSMRSYIDLKEQSPLLDSIEEILTKSGYQIINLRANQASKIGDNKNITKITKLISRFAPELLDGCNTEIQKESSHDYQVVISRNPVDIAAMSTDRRWDSCMNIRTGKNSKFVDEDIVEGTIIAYVIQHEDLEIEDPINRILIKPFYNKDGDIKLVLDSKVYYHHNDKPIAGFLETVQCWLDSKQGVLKGFYTLNDYLYDDGLSNTIESKIMRPLLQKYTKVNFNLHGYAIIEKDSHVGLVDSKGTIITEPIYSNIWKEDVGVEPFIRVSKYTDMLDKQTTGMMDYNGKEVVPCEYWYIDKKGSGWELTKKGKDGIVHFNFDGHTISPK